MDVLRDPLQDRQCKDVPRPYVLPIPKDKLRDGNGDFDYQLISQFLQREGKLNKASVMEILKDALKVLSDEPNCVRVPQPCTIVGDIHGQFYDLIKVLDKCTPKKNNFLFMGDYVDRGIYSLECTILLLSIKCNFPKSFMLLRGNHETRQCAEHFSFRAEMLEKYDEEVYDLCMQVFDALPLVAIVAGDYLCMHGGISPKWQPLDEINKIDRFSEVPIKGLITDIVWSDPVDDAKAETKEYTTNKERQCACKYGAKPLRRILQSEKLSMLIRAHQVQMEGYKFHNWEGEDEAPLAVTLFSAPNYCDVYNNKGAIIRVAEDAFNIKSFKSAEHPYYLPKKVDLFKFSMKFLSSKVTEIFAAILDQCMEEDMGDEEDYDATNPTHIEMMTLMEAAHKNNPQTEDTTIRDMRTKTKKMSIIKSKVKMMGRLTKIYNEKHMVKQELMKKQMVVADKKIDAKFIIMNSPLVSFNIKQYQLAQQQDIKNEMNPACNKKSLIEEIDISRNE